VHRVNKRPDLRSMKQYTYYQLHINKLLCSVPYRSTDNSSWKGTQNGWSYRRMVKVKSHLSRLRCNKTITRRAMSAYRHTKASSRNHCCPGKAKNITYSECVSVALVIQTAKRMLHIIFSSVDCPALPCFSPHYLNKWHDFREKNIEHKIVCDFLHFCLQHFSF
jgi:hypothetical protein